jgi:hypothetical protein
LKCLGAEGKISEITSVNADNKITKYKPQLFQLEHLDTGLQQIGISVSGKLPAVFRNSPEVECNRLVTQNNIPVFVFCRKI